MKGQRQQTGLGVFVEGDGLLHRLDARLKLLLVVATALLVFLAPWSALPAAVAFGAFLSLVVVSGRASIALRALKPLAFIVLLALTMRAFDPSVLQIPAGGAPSEWPHAYLPTVMGQLPFSVSGAFEGLLQASKVIAVALTAALLCATTAPVTLIAGMSWLLRPLAVIGVPVDRAAKVGGMALCALPAVWTLVAARFSAIDPSQAQTASGAPHLDASGSYMSRCSGRVTPYVDALVMSLVDSVTQSRALCEPVVTSDSLDRRTA